MSVERPRGRWSLTFHQHASRRQIETHALDLSMRVLSYCAEQDIHSGGFLTTVDSFKRILEAQQIPGAIAATALSSLRPTKTPSTSFSETSFSDFPGQSQLPASAAFATQPYSNNIVPANPSAPLTHYTSSSGRSDSQSTNYSNIYDWMTTDVAGVEAAGPPMNHESALLQTTTTQHYHPYLQDFQRLEELSAMGYFGDSS
jgi:hypothetical protein